MQSPTGVTYGLKVQKTRVSGETRGISLPILVGVGEQPVTEIVLPIAGDFFFFLVALLAEAQDF